MRYIIFQRRPRAQRGTTLIFCVVMIVVLGIIANSMAARYLSRRRAQQRTEIARAERLLFANSEVLTASALGSGDLGEEPGDTFVYEDGQLSITLTTETAAESVAVRATAAGIHPQAAIAANFVLAPSGGEGDFVVRHAHYAPQPPREERR